MTDRDEFAAAALTGLLSDIPRYQLGPLTEQAFEIADEMLLKRSQYNSDAVVPERSKGEVRVTPDKSSLISGACPLRDNTPSVAGSNPVHSIPAEVPALTRGEVFAIRYCLTRTLEKHLVGHFRKDEQDVCIHGVMLKQTLLDLIDRFPCKPKD